MGKIDHHSLCPLCRDGKISRERRHDWMRRLPQSKYYRCKACGGRFLTLWGWAIRLPKKQVEKD